MVETTIIIPTYFANNMLHQCIKSLMDNVVNPQILIYKNDIGWLQACNKMMQEVKGDVLLLNDDTYVLTDIVAEMQKVAYSDDSVGIVGGKSLSPNQDTIINYGIHIAVDGNTAHKHYGKSRNSVKMEYQRAVEGSAMYIKRELINQIHYFDERYGQGYRAEVDYCLRAREKGFKIVSSPKAEYVHFGSQTMSQLGHTNDTHEIFMEQWGKALMLGKV